MSHTPESPNAAASTLPSFETLSLSQNEGITRVRLERPTMPPQVFRDLKRAFEWIQEDENTRVVLLSSSTKAFTYGLDLSAAFSEFGEALSGAGAKQRVDLFHTIKKLQSTFDTIQSCPAPIIALVHGWCIGGGVDLVSACDIRYASADAQFSIRETKMAIVADMGTLQRLPPIIGQGHTRELAFTGRDFSAAYAEKIGLMNAVYESREALEEAALNTAKEIAQNPPLTVRGVKQVLNFGLESRIQDSLRFVAAWNAAALPSEDLGEAMSSFIEKRPPNYRGR